MPELNKANRQVCDVDIRFLSSGKPFLFLDTANTTTQNISGDSVYAMAKGQRAIAYTDPITGTMTIEAQVLPFKIYSLMSDGVVHSDAEYPKHETIVATKEGALTLSETPSGTVYAYVKGEFGDETSLISGSVSGKEFTASSTEKIAVGSSYEVGYVVSKTSGVHRISFGDNYAVLDYTVTMSTVEKDEDGNLTPYIIKAYKATPQRNFELSQASEGDPASITITFDLLRDKNGDVIDMIEDVE